MKRNFILGLSISIGNLFFYALAMDLLFSFGIYQQVIGFDVHKFFGTNSLYIGIGAALIAMSLEVISYRVIRRGANSSNKVDMK